MLKAELDIRELVINLHLHSGVIKDFSLFTYKNPTKNRIMVNVINVCAKQDAIEHKFEMNSVYIITVLRPFVSPK